MADNITITPGTGTSLSTDDVGAGLQVQRVKVQFGVDGSAADVSSAAPLPVTIISGGTGGTQYAEDAAHVSGDLGNLMLAIRNTTAATLTSATGDYSGVAVNAQGAVLGELQISYQTTSGGGGILKAEDAASADGDAGVAILGVRRDTASSLTTANGDYIMAAYNANGGALIDINFDWQISTSKGLMKLEDAAHTSGDAGVMALAVRNNNLATSFTSADADYSPVAVDQYGAVFLAVAGANAPMKLEDAAHTTGDAGIMFLGVRNDTLAALTSADGDYGALSISDRGSLRVELVSGGVSFYKAEDAAHTSSDLGVFCLAVRNDAQGAVTSADGDYSQIAVNNRGNVYVDINSDGQFSSAKGILKNEDNAHATADAGVFVLAVRNDSLGTTFCSANGDYSPFAVGNRGEVLIGGVAVEDTAAVDGSYGLQILAVRNDALAAKTSTDGDYGALAIDAAGKLFVQQSPGTSNGWSKVKYLAQTTTVQTVKGTAGNLGGYFIYNPNTSVAYVQVFDAATATTITLGTTAPDLVFAIPASSGANVEFSNGVSFTNGIKLACTTTDSGLTAPGTGLTLNIFYK